MHKIAVVNTKGGVGKTTLASALAVRAAKESPRVAMVDLDPQRSLVEWWMRRGKTDNPQIMEGVDTAADAVDRLERTGWDYVFFDGPPAFLSLIQEIVTVADFALIPIKASTLDILATQDAVILAQQAGTAFMCVVNDVSQGDARVVESARSTLFNTRLPIAQTVVKHRISHITGMTVGKSAAEVNAGRDKEAAGEIDALWQEIKVATIKAGKAKAKRARAVNV